MADHPRSRAWKTASESTGAGITHSSFSTASSRTKRRKLQRSISGSKQQYEEMAQLRGLFQHIRILGRDDAYGKLNKDLVVAEPDPIIMDYSLMHPPPIPNLKPEQYTFVKACTPVEMAHLKHFDREPIPLTVEAEAAIQPAAEYCAELLNLDHYLIFPPRSAISEVRYYPEKFAGIEYATMGLKTRREADPVAQQDAEHSYERLMQGESVHPHDVRLGGRGKITEMDRSGVEAKIPAVGRLILMLSHRDLKLCGITENLLTQAYTPDRFPIAVGQSWYHGGTAEFVERFLPYEKFHCFDAKKFDSGIDPWMVRLAINILRRQFFEWEDEKYDTYWEFVFQSLVRAPIYRDDGVRFQKEVGTTSGHSHNSLIQSVITLILGYAVMAALNPELEFEELAKLMWVESMGDDNIIGVRGILTRHTTEEIAQAMSDLFHINWHGKKSFATTRLLDAIEGEFKGVQFLGKYFRLSEYPELTGVVDIPLPYRPAKETYLRLLYPEYGELNTTDTMLRVLGNYIDAAGNSAMESWLQGLLDVLEDKVGALPEEWPSNFRRIVSRDYSNTGIELPRPRRIGFVQWRDLIVLGKSDYRKQWGMKGFMTDDYF